MIISVDVGGGYCFVFFFQAEDGIRDYKVTGVQTCALPIWDRREGHSPAPPVGPWRIYGKTSDMISPAPASLWVIIDENPDSVNDAALAVKMDWQGPAALWQDGPATYHGGGCGFTFADGHAEIRKWKDSRTVGRPMLTTYATTFPYAVFQGNNKDIAWVQERTTAKVQ